MIKKEVDALVNQAADSVANIKNSMHQNNNNKEVGSSLHHTIQKVIDTIETNQHDSLYTDDIYVGNPP